MRLLSEGKFKEIVSSRKREFESLFPEFVKRLILASNRNVIECRFPSDDGIVTSGYDGIVNCTKKTTHYVPLGKSVWELGSNSDALSKIKSDCKKRTANSIGVDKKETTFFLVIAKNWNYKGQSITEWENEQIEWKEAHVYDASILCDWLNNEPAVLAWFLEQTYHEELVSFSTIENAWNKFAAKVSPVFVTDMFLLGREKQGESFAKQLGDKKKTVRIKGPTMLDSEGFVLAWLISEKLYIEDVVAVYDTNTYKFLDREVNGKIFLLLFSYDGDVSENNHVILCFNKEAISIKDAIMIPPLTRTNFESALRKMRLPDMAVNEMYHFTHGNLRTLVRRIRGNSNDTQPDWCNRDDIYALYPLLFLNSLNIERDKELVESLSGMGIDIIENGYRMMSMLEDAPVKLVSGDYTIVNPEEVRDALGLDVHESHFIRLTRTIKYIITELEKNGTCYGKRVYDFKNTFRKLVDVYIDYAIDESSSDKVEKAITDLLNGVKDNAYELVMDNLSVLAEAAPKSVLKYIESFFKYENGLRNGDERVIYALERLVLKRETFKSAVELLIKFRDNEYENSYARSPMQSLPELLCLWRTDCDVSIEQRSELLQKLVASSNFDNIRIVIDTLAVRTYFRGYRLGEHGTVKLQFDDKKYYSAVITVTECILDKAIEIHSASLIKRVLENQIELNLSLEQMKKTAERIVLREYNEEEVYDLNFFLRDKVYAIKRYGWSDYTPFKDGYYDLIKGTEYGDDIKDATWMFMDWWQLPDESLLIYKNNLQELAAKAKELRSKVICELYEKYGKNALFHICAYMDNSYYFGVLLDEVVVKDMFAEISDYLLKCGKHNVVIGMVDNYDLETGGNYLHTLKIDKELIIEGLKNIELLIFLDETEKKLFWSNYSMLEYSDDVYKELLKHNPLGVIPYIYYEIRQNPSLCVDMTTRVFKAICSMESVKVSRNYKDQIIDVMDRISDVQYTDDFGELCYKVRCRTGISMYPNPVSRLIFEHPKMLKELLDGDSQEKWNFSGTYKLHDYGYENYEDFKKFMEELTLVETGQGRQYLYSGAVLGRSKKASDGWFPHEFVRMWLEEKDSDELDHLVANSFEELRTGRIVSDGSDEQEKSRKYLQKADEIMDKFHHTAQVLRIIGEYYKQNADMDYKYSETGQI